MARKKEASIVDELSSDIELEENLFVIELNHLKTENEKYIKEISILKSAIQELKDELGNSRRTEQALKSQIERIMSRRIG